MRGRRFGYARVSSRDQNEARQLVALRDAGVKESMIFTDKTSGKDFDRPAYSRMVRSLAPGDELLIGSIDRLGRNYEEILRQWRILTKEKKVDIIVLDMPVLNTHIEESDLTGTFVSDLVLQILSYVAQRERESIKQRQKEGIQAAKQRGVRFGRPPMERPKGFDRLAEEWRCKRITSVRAAAILGVPRQTFARWVKASEKEG